MHALTPQTIVITAVVTFLFTSVLWIGLGASVYFLRSDKPPEFEVTVTHPATVEV